MIIWETGHFYLGTNISTASTHTLISTFRHGITSRITISRGFVVALPAGRLSCLKDQRWVRIAAEAPTRLVVAAALAAASRSRARGRAPKVIRILSTGRTGKAAAVRVRVLLELAASGHEGSPLHL